MFLLPNTVRNLVIATASRFVDLVCNMPSQLVYNSTKYHQYTSKSVVAIVITMFLLPNTVRGVNSKTATSRVVAVECNLPSQPYVQSYLVSIYLKGCWSSSDHKVSITKYCQGR